MESNDTSTQETSLPFVEAIRGDASTLAEMLLAIIPIVAYGCVYYVRWRKYVWLGISHDLVSVRLEDLLLAGVFALVLYWSQLANWLVAVVNPKRRRRRQLALRIVDVVLVLVLAVQTCLLVSISVRAHVFDVYQYIMLGLQAILFATWMLASSGRWVFKNRSKNSISATLFVCAMLFVALSVGRAAYFVFHTAEYQVCPEDNALVVALVDEGWAVEKEIVRMEDGGMCELSPGYVIRDMDGKRLYVTHFTYVVAHKALP